MTGLDPDDEAARWLEQQDLAGGAAAFEVEIQVEGSTAGGSSSSAAAEWPTATASARFAGTSRSAASSDRFPQRRPSRDVPGVRKRPPHVLHPAARVRRRLRPRLRRPLAARDLDLLSGLLLDTSWDDRLRLLNISLTYDAEDTRFDVLERYLAEVGLGFGEPWRSVGERSRLWTWSTRDTRSRGRSGSSPAGLNASARWTWSPGSSGSSGSRGARRPARRRGDGSRTAVVVSYAPGLVKNVSSRTASVTLLAARAPKTSRTYFAGRWGDPDETAPARSDEARDALALALHLYDLGRSREWRLRFAKEPARQPAMTEGVVPLADPRAQALSAARRLTSSRTTGATSFPSSSIARSVLSCGSEPTVNWIRKRSWPKSSC